MYSYLYSRDSMKDYNIALVIVTYNRSELLVQTLTSVLELKLRPSKLYIIDNNSTDNTKKIIDEYIIENKHILDIAYYNTGSNLGGAGGFEYGSKLAYNDGYEWIWLADDDITFDTDCLSNLYFHRGAGSILQPMRLNTDGSCAEISGVDYKINNVFYLNPKRIKITDVYSEPWEIKEISTIPFEGPLINRAVFTKIGFPDPKFFIFYDDLDFALRAQHSGFKVICVKSSIIVRKIKFVQSRALSSWKGYFMYRNFFKVQMTYAQPPIGILRSLIIFIIVSLYSVFTGKVKFIPTLFQALKDAMNKEFPLDERFKP